MSTLTRAEARERLEARIFDGTEFSFGNLYPLCDKVEGMTDSWRAADAAIQANRRKGFISFERRGRQTVWSLTAEGLVEKARRESLSKSSWES